MKGRKYMDKSGVKNFAIEARKVLRESAIKKAGFYGITIDNISEPVQKLPDSEVFKTIAGDEIRLFADDLNKRNNLVSAIRSLGFEQVIEETAYTWFNRLIAIRFMEINDYLPSRVRVLSSEAGGSTPDIVRDAMEVDLNLSKEELDKIQKAKDENRYDDAFQMLFVKQCNELNAILPGLFEKTDDYMELLLDISYTGDGVVRMLTSMIPEDDFNVESQGQVEIIGWMYQYYNTELKDDTFAKLKKNIKITKERIPAATQLFTPDWIVRYMVENSLGRVWIDHLRAVDPTVDEKKKAEEYGWKYYLPEAEQEENVAAELVKVRAEYKDLTPQDILCIDPCSGSGHILVYMFDMLLAIYESEGISERDAVFDILEKNIFGLDIDKRAYQLSYFALMMKGRGVVGRRFFRGVETEDGERRPIQLNVYAIDESNGVDKNVLDAYGVSMSFDEREKAKEQVETLLSEMWDAKEYGSIINVTDFDMDLVKRYLFDRDEEGQLNLLHMDVGKGAENIWRLAKIGKALAQKYDAVVTNPPYMGNSGMSPLLSKYVQNNYIVGKWDMYAVFILKVLSMSNKLGYSAMITQQSWMFQGSFKKLRSKMLLNRIVDLIHLGSRAFDEIAGEVVQVASFVITNKHITNYSSTFIDVKDNMGEKEKEKEYLSGKARYYSIVDDYAKLPDLQIAYWISKHTLSLLSAENTVSNYGVALSGLSTSDNERFLRLWFEVSPYDISYNYSSCEDTLDGKYKWVPHNKGGSFRRWYGNRDYIVNWENDGEEIKYAVVHNPTDPNTKSWSRRIFNWNYFFKQGISWSDVATGKLACRFEPDGIIFNATGPTFFVNNVSSELYFLGYFNSCVFQSFLGLVCPGLHYNTGPIMKLPVIYDKEGDVKQKVKDNINLSRIDWDSFETSWDFVEHPLMPHIYKAYDIDESDVKEEGIYMEAAYETWKNVCDINFDKLKCNEEELNRIFIDIYGLQDELTPDVAEKDVTVRRIFDTKDDIPDTMKGSGYAITKRDVIISFLSYAVGCMFGRYSLDEEGLVYAGGEFDSSKYKTFPADEDAIIPITDEEYFDDDIVKRFVEFVNVVYGEDTLEDNLDFIAGALGGKGTTSREIIRNYFLNDFFKDHAKTYSVTGSGKRPIYWLFDSGKQNGFKCLIYMHRYTPDTVGLIRSVYLKNANDAIQKALDNAEYIIANTESNVDRAMSTKKRDKYVKQLAEIKPYYQALSHVAMQRIEIDLDDGVKVNYAKFQGIEVGGDGEKKQTVNLLAKI